MVKIHKLRQPESVVQARGGPRPVHLLLREAGARAPLQSLECNCRGANLQRLGATALPIGHNARGVTLSQIWCIRGKGPVALVESLGVYQCQCNASGRRTCDNNNNEEPGRQRVAAGQHVRAGRERHGRHRPLLLHVRRVRLIECAAAARRLQCRSALFRHAAVVVELSDQGHRGRLFEASGAKGREPERPIQTTDRREGELLQPGGGASRKGIQITPGAKSAKRGKRRHFRIRSQPAMGGSGGERCREHQ